MYNPKIQKLYDLCRDRWVSVEEMSHVVGLDASGCAAILQFTAQLDVDCKYLNGIRQYRNNREED